MRHPSTSGHQLVILDIDGTLLDTPHLLAWQRALTEVVGGAGATLSEVQYLRDVAGKPRESGARAALAAVGATPTKPLVDRLTETKQGIFQQLSGRTELFPDARRFLTRAAALGIPLAFCTASGNAGALLRDCLTGLPRAEWLTVRLSKSLSPNGRREEAARTDALRRLGRIWQADLKRCMLIDDAEHGVAAGEELGISTFLVDRSEGRATAGADVRRVSSLDDIVIDATGVVRN